MKTLILSDENLQTQHICCAFSDKKCMDGYRRKKEWLKSEFENGYTFRKFDVRGKVFIEYVPIEKSWLPFDGKNFMVINCFWVSGQFKGLGYGKRLLQECVADAEKKGMDGVIAVASDKKRPFMSEPRFFKKHGMEVIDEAPPFFKLWGLKINPDAEFPTFKSTAKVGRCPNKEGITAYYSNTCPYTEYYTGHMLKEYGRRKNLPVTLHKINSQADGHKMPIPWIINSVFYKGELVTLEMKAERHLEKLIKNMEQVQVLQ